MLKPALARGEIQCIGATTLDEYRQHIEKDGALERRFQKVIVEPTSIEETIHILHNIKERYEEHHNVIYTDDAIDACVKLTNRYISDRHLPDKAIDALDESGSRVHISNIVVPEKILLLEKQLEDTKKEKMMAVKNQNFEKAASFRDREKDLLDLIDQEKKKWEKELAVNRETVDADKVAEVVAMMTGVPVQRIAQTEGTRLLNMAEELKGSVIGQDEAIQKVVKSIQRNRAGLKDPNKPIGTFIFLGPTGVGKTQLAKVLAKFLFDTTDNLVRIDMSEYMEKFSVSRLVGAPPGYVGYEEGGQLTEAVRRHPYSVVLLDEIEKANPDVFDILLQVLDDGRLTDGKGRTVNFRNTVIIMTSNIGSDIISRIEATPGTLAYEEEYSRITTVVLEHMKTVFRPEFLNRVDEVVVFNPLGQTELTDILSLVIDKTVAKVRERDIELTVSDELRRHLVTIGYDPVYGARPLKRTVQKVLEDRLADALLSGEVKPGDKVLADYEADRVVFHKQ